MTAKRFVLIIGIVAHEKACVDHVEVLRKAGYEVLRLEPEGTTFPQTLSGIVLLTGQFSEMTRVSAVVWGHIYGKFIVYAKSSIGCQAEEGAAEKFLSQVSEKADVSRQAAIKAWARTYTTSTEENLPMKTSPGTPVSRWPEDFPWTQNWPGGCSWARVVNRERLFGNVAVAHELFRKLTPDAKKRVQDAFTHFPSDSLTTFCQQTLLTDATFLCFDGTRGKPIQWLALVLLCLDQKAMHSAPALAEAYRLFNSGKRASSYAVQATAWATGRSVFTSKASKLTLSKPGMSVSSLDLPRPETAERNIRVLQKEADELKNTNAMLVRKLDRLGDQLGGLVRRLERLENQTREKELAALKDCPFEQTPQASSDLVEQDFPESVLTSLRNLKARGGEITISFRADL